ncbi:hypothetical protein ABBQ32_004377 [Trebouxia sp. C0010 RCD-2024]
MPGKHRLYMHCPGLTEDQLYMYLQQFGRVTDVYLPKGLDGQSKGYGFASFENTDGLTAALAAGEEHSIRGKTVRVNRAGPRPALHLQSSSDPGRPQQVPPSTVPIAGGVSRQRGGFSLAEPSSSGSLHQSIGASGTDWSGSGPTLPDSSNASRSSLPQGAGPRIYVGGIPNAVSETMVRKYFANWGKVEDVYFPKERATGRRRPFCFVTFALQKAAEKAVAQSNREISGYQVASISMTADRIAHYQQVSGGGDELQRMFQDIEPAHPFALSLQGLFPHLAVAQAQQAGLSNLGENVGFGHQQGLPSLGVDNPLGPLLGLGGQMNYTVDDLAALRSSVFPMGQQHMQQQGQQQQPANVGAAAGNMPQLSGASALQPGLQEALLAANISAGDISTSRLFSAPGIMGAPAYTQLNLHPDVVSQQQAVAHQHAHQAVVGQHAPQAGQFGHGMSSYNSCPLDMGTVLRAQLAAAAPHGAAHPGLAPGLPRNLSAGQTTGLGPDASSNNSQPQGFDPTVRRPGDNFGEAPSAQFGSQLMEPCLFSQVPDLHKAMLHGPMRRFLPGIRSSRPAPY